MGSGSSSPLLRLCHQSAASATSAAPKTASSAVTLFAMFRSRLRPSVTTPHALGSWMGTSATNGAQMPAKFSSTSSESVLPLSDTRQTPMATSAPTNRFCTGV